MMNSIFPTSLTDVITQNKEDLILDAEDINVLRPMVTININGTLKGEINPTYLISFLWEPGTSKEERHIHLLGEHVSLKAPYMSSRIVAATPDLRQVRTHSGSIYKISDVQTSAPPPEFLLHLCYSMHYWQFGSYFGVLEVCY